MRFYRTVKLQVEVDAPTEFDANETIADIFGSAEDFGIHVVDITITGRRKP